MHRNVYGVHAPIRLLMERKIVSRVRRYSTLHTIALIPVQNPHMPAFPQSNLHLDILMGRDEILDTPDFMGGASVGLDYFSLHNLLHP
jgi:proteasome maturation protein